MSIYYTAQQAKEAADSYNYSELNSLITTIMSAANSGGTCTRIIQLQELSDETISDIESRGFSIKKVKDTTQLCQNSLSERIVYDIS